MGDTLIPTPDEPGVSVFTAEVTRTMVSGVWRSSLKVADFPHIALLRSLFAKVELVSLEAEARQDNLLGEDTLASKGHVFLAVIPTVKDTDSASGASTAIVKNVPNKQTFPLSDTSQNDRVFNFNLKGYELDLAQDPRRGAGPVAWIGNSGIIKAGDAQENICTVTWRAEVKCSGSTPLWN